MGKQILQHNRLQALDGLRGLAIIMVVIYHYFSRFAVEGIYPYGSALANLPLAQDGFVGVYLFFIVSGFVIIRSLAGSTSPLDFVVKRANRLVLPMVVLSTFTFAFISVLPQSNFEVGLADFLPSWTFTNPAYWRWLDHDVSYIDGVYWTLFVEVRFYALMAAIWFLSRKGWATVAICGVAALSVVANIFLTGLPLVALRQLLFPEFIALFACGVIYSDAMQKGISNWHIIALALLVPLSIVALAEDGGIGLGHIAAWIIIFNSIFISIVLGWTPISSMLSFGPLVFTGTISYSLYLIHQRVGVDIISLLPRGLNLWLYVICVLGVSCLMVALAWLSWKHLESRRPFEFLRHRNSETRDA